MGKIQEYHKVQLSPFPLPLSPIRKISLIFSTVFEISPCRNFFNLRFDPFYKRIPAWLPAFWYKLTIDNRLSWRGSMKHKQEWWMGFHGAEAEKQEELEEQVPPRKRWGGCSSGLELSCQIWVRIVARLGSWLNHQSLIFLSCKMEIYIICLCLRIEWDNFVKAHDGLLDQSTSSWSVSSHIAKCFFLPLSRRISFRANSFVIVYIYPYI